MIYTASKRMGPFPFAHRQPNHAGHCHLIHGHNWHFEFEFNCLELDGNGFVQDFGDLKALQFWLAERFDHTLVINRDDPKAEQIKEGLYGLAKVVAVENCGAEGIAAHLHKFAGEIIRNQTSGRVWIRRVTVWENDNNSATYTTPPAA